MSPCENRNDCAFFNSDQKAMPGIAGKLKEWFCLKDKERCARYMVLEKLQTGHSPSDKDTESIIRRTLNAMHPNDYEKAEMLIRSLHKAR